MCKQIRKYEMKLVKVIAELEEKKSKLEAVHLSLTDVKDGGVKSNSAKAEKLDVQNTNMTGSANTDENQNICGIIE